ncbi:hypothetical protein BX285_7219 [Streptomyces sp. 1114.5]|uniref:DUF6126 family protein n=1 Tax=unclassified Streptomyces TaxID=2593676 RepID=UPI000BCA5E70|nr:MULTISPECIES: DUF6126 family protein [unclassified Streptomyces]RKT08851.1 hypothetical protein BX285_7219 [Streptomyces sp. 1114.5]SOB79176.1 hypothetical protein SAMN06272789_0295 [Streptomyces sp. 1331.2]
MSSSAGDSTSTSNSTSTSDSTSDEKKRRKAMLIRAGIYIFATHLFAGFVLLLFALGGRK